MIKFSGHVIDETRIGDNDITLTRIRYNHINSLPTRSSADNLCKQLDPDQAEQNVGPDLDPNCLTLMVFVKDFYVKS